MAAVLVVDQVDQALVQSNVTEGDRDNVFFGVDIVHVRNHGVAFGAFAGGGTIVALIIAGRSWRWWCGSSVTRARRWRGCRPGCCSAAPWATSSTASATAR